MNIQIINKLHEDGTLVAMLKEGFISRKAFFYREVYLWLEAQVIARNITKLKAAQEAVTRFNISERTVWRINACFNQG